MELEIYHEKQVWDQGYVIATKLVRCIFSRQEFRCMKHIDVKIATVKEIACKWPISVINSNFNATCLCDFHMKTLLESI